MKKAMPVSSLRRSISGASKQGFTLIELLTVIAIIGLLSGIVYASLRNARNKARIAAGLSFSQSLYNALGSEAVGVWGFEDITGNQTSDGSGNGNIGFINGAVQVPGDITALGKALSFDGVYDSMVVLRTASLEPSSVITVEAWVKPNTGYGKTYPRIIDKSAGGENRGYYFLIIASNGTVRWSVDLRVSGDTYIDSVGAIPVNQWSHLVGTYDGSAMRIYINGKLDKEQIGLSGIIDQAIAKDLIIGDDGTNARNFGGLIDEVRVYNQSLTIAEIQKHYVEGIKKFRLSAL